VPTAAGYLLREWTGPAPEEILASFATARQAISDAPAGEMTWGDPAWTPERVRLDEATRAASNAEQRVVVAVHEASGAVVGVTELFVLAREPEHGRQQDTAVLGEHRGHGLGRAMKSAMLRRLVVEHPETVRVSTQTAADNVYMAAVNHQIGYRTLWTHSYVEADVEDLEKRLG
jgi:RimJ/RimL family protein N-acetyltransferase